MVPRQLNVADVKRNKKLRVEREFTTGNSCTTTELRNVKYTSGHNKDPLRNVDRHTESSPAACTLPGTYRKHIIKSSSAFMVCLGKVLEIYA